MVRENCICDDDHVDGFVELTKLGFLSSSTFCLSFNHRCASKDCSATILKWEAPGMVPGFSRIPGGRKCSPPATQ